MNKSFLGLDFGCAFSAMSAYNAQSCMPEIINDEQGELKIPSIVYYDNQGCVKVGFSAWNYLEEMDCLTPEECFDIGNGVFFWLKRNLLRNSARILPNGKKVCVYDAVVELFRYFRQCAEKNFFKQPVENVSIAYSPLYGDTVLQLLTLAAKEAGFKEVVMAPDAIATVMGNEISGTSLGNNVLVYDLGAGSFSITFVHKDANSSYSTPCGFSGLKNCSGANFDLAVCNYLNQKYDIDFTDLTSNMLLLVESHQARERLSKSANASFSHYSVEQNEHFRIQLSREEYENLIYPFISKTIQLLTQMIEKTKQDGYSIDALVLNGSCTKTPLILKELERLSTEGILKAPIVKSYNKETTALGAVCYSNEYLEQGKSTDLPKQVSRQTDSSLVGSDKNSTPTQPVSVQTAAQSVSNQPSPSPVEVQNIRNQPAPSSVESQLIPVQTPSNQNPLPSVQTSADSAGIAPSVFNNASVQNEFSGADLFNNASPAILRQMSIDQWTSFVDKRRKIHNCQFLAVKEILRHIWDMNDIVFASCNTLNDAEQMSVSTPADQRIEAYWHAIYDSQFPDFQSFLDSFALNFTSSWESSVKFIIDEYLNLEPEELAQFNDLFTIPPADVNVLHKRMVQQLCSLEMSYNNMIQLNAKMKESFKTLKTFLKTGRSTSTAENIFDFGAAFLFGVDNDYNRSIESANFAQQYGAMINEYLENGSAFSTNARGIVSNQIDLLAQYWDGAFFHLLPVYDKMAQLGHNLFNLNQEISAYHHKEEHLYTQKDHDVLSLVFQRMINNTEVSPSDYQLLITELIEQGYCFASDGSIKMDDYNRLPSGLSDEENVIVNYQKEFLEIFNSFDWEKCSYNAFLSGNIPTDKITNAINAYGQNLFSADTILVLWDNTMFGTATEGFVITFEGLAWRNSGFITGGASFALCWNEMYSFYQNFNDSMDNSINNCEFNAVVDNEARPILFDLFKKLSACAKKYFPPQN